MMGVTKTNKIRALPLLLYHSAIEQVAVRPLPPQEQAGHESHWQSLPKWTWCRFCYLEGRELRHDPCVTDLPLSQVIFKSYTANELWLMGTNESHGWLTRGHCRHATACCQCLVIIITGSEVAFLASELAIRVTNGNCGLEGSGTHHFGPWPLKQKKQVWT